MQIEPRAIVSLGGPPSRQKQQTTKQRKSMNNQFDELTKAMAQSVTRRGALKKFGVGLAGMALACFGLTNKAVAAPHDGYCQLVLSGPVFEYTGICIDIKGCVSKASADCPIVELPVSPRRVRDAC